MMHKNLCLILFGVFSFLISNNPAANTTPSYTSNYCGYSQHPCVCHNVIDGSYNRTVNYMLPSNDEEDCESRNLTEGWYRYDNYGNIPTSPPSAGQCGSSSPIWLNGSYPTTYGESKTITACMATNASDCESSWNVTVMNCCVFNVAYLTAIEECGRYCLDDHENPCLNHTVIASSYNRTFSYYLQPGDVDDCESANITEGWHRYDNIMNVPTSPPSVGQCGSSSPIWFNGSYPTISGETRTLTACMVTNTSNCEFSWNVTVMNCCGYNVAYLTAVDYCGRYCIEDHPIWSYTSTPSYMSSYDHPCLNNTVIDGSYNRSVSYYLQSNDTEDCETTNFTAGWYRYSNLGNIPTQAPSVGQCGSSSPIWLNGSYPTYYGKSKTMTACMVTIGSNCEPNWNVSVMNCGYYNVAYLTAIDQCGRYCLDDSYSSTTDDYTTWSTPSNFDDECYANQTLVEDDYTRSPNYTVSGENSTCESDNVTAGWYRLENHQKIPTTIPVPGGCGSTNPIYLQGTYPTMIGETRTMMFCMVDSTLGCKESWSVQVKQCNGYQVAFINQTENCGRYCLESTKDTEDQTTTDNYTTWSTPSTSSDYDDECYANHTLVEDDYTRSPYFTVPEENSTCESDNVTASWYRLENHQKIPTTSPLPGGCGSTNPIYLQGTYPTMIGETRTMMFCMLDSTLGCKESWSVQVKQCNGYRVAFINQTENCGRYCLESTNDTVDQTTTDNYTTWSTPSTSSDYEDECYANLTLAGDDYTRSPNYTVPEENSTCESDNITAGWYRLENHQKIPTTKPVSGGCGSTNPIYFPMGTYPTMIGETRLMMFCMMDSVTICKESWSVQVKQCNGYRVIFINQTEKCGRYCLESTNDTVDQSTPANYTTWSTPSDNYTTWSTPSTSSDYDDECNLAYYIPSDYTRSIQYNLSSEENGTCESSNVTEGWYRFSGLQNIPTQRPDPGQCGSMSPIYLQGSYPTMNGYYSTMTACMVDDTGGCKEQWSVVVKHCSGYNIAYLNNTVNCGKYCMEDTASQSTTQSTSPSSSASSYFMYCKPDLFFSGDTTRRASYQLQQGDIDSCDIFSGWHVFTGNFQIPTTPAESGQCGSSSPIYFQGSYPTMTGESTTLVACVVGNGTECKESFNVTALNCGGYNVVNLKTPTTCGRYCLYDIITDDSSTSTTTSYDECDYHYVEIDVETRSISYNLSAGDNGTCESNNLTTGWYRYLNNHLIPTTRPMPGQCGTLNPIYLQGTYPTMVGDSKTLTACMVESTTGCKETWPVLVKQCNGYKIAYLNASQHCGRYCLEDTASQSTTESTVPSSSASSYFMYCYMQMFFYGDTTRKVSYQLQQGDIDSCDVYSGWYQVFDNFHIPTTPVVSGQCGSSSPIYFQGSYPTMTGESTTLVACVVGNGTECKESFNVTAFNCGGYTILNLKTPTTCGRYCLNDTTTDDSSTSTTTSYDECDYHYVEIDIETRSTSYNLSAGDNGTCESNNLTTGWYRYLNNHLIPTTRPMPGQCGSLNPIYLQGTYPTMVGDSKTLTACMVESTTGCKETWPVLVKQCNGYKIAYLNASQYCGRYCLEDATIDSSTVMYNQSMQQTTDMYSMEQSMWESDSPSIHSSFVESTQNYLGSDMSYVSTYEAMSTMLIPSDTDSKMTMGYTHDQTWTDSMMSYSAYPNFISTDYEQSTLYTDINTSPSTTQSSGSTTFDMYGSATTHSSGSTTTDMYGTTTTHSPGSTTTDMYGTTTTPSSGSTTTDMYGTATTPSSGSTTTDMYGTTTTHSPGSTTTDMYGTATTPSSGSTTTDMYGTTTTHSPGSTTTDMYGTATTPSSESTTTDMYGTSTTYLSGSITTQPIASTTSQWSASSSSSYDDECNTFYIFGNETRSLNYNLSSGDTGTCESNNITAAWYRYRNYQNIPTQRPVPGQCGSWAPIYMQGTYPTVSGQYSTMTACMVNDIGGCMETWSIVVKRCNGYNVAYLNNTVNCGRYCMESTTTDMYGTTTTHSSGSTTTDMYGTTTTHLPGSTTTDMYGTATTHSPGSTTTDMYGTATTHSPGLTTTDMYGTATTPSSGSTTTDMYGTTTTHLPGSTTTDMYGTATTPSSGSTTTDMYGTATTPSSGSTTTDMYGTTTTHSSGSTTTDMYGTATTHSPGSTTTDMYGTATTPSSGSTTTDMYGTTTTHLPGSTTTDMYGTATTHSPGLTTTDMYGTATTPSSGSTTTDMYGTTTTHLPGSTTTDMYGTATTPSSGSTTTDMYGTATTHSPGSTTTDMYGTATTPSSGSTTTDMYGTTTTHSPGSTTTDMYGTVTTPSSGSITTQPIASTTSQWSASTTSQWSASTTSQWSSSASSSYDDECNTFYIFGNETRSLNYNLSSGDTGTCESNNVTAAWYRYRNYQNIPTQRPVPGQCGSWAPIYMQGTYPTVSGQYSTMTACMVNDIGGCMETWSIDVKRCNGYNVAYLTNTVNCGRYCMEDTIQSSSWYSSLMSDETIMTSMYNTELYTSEMSTYTMDYGDSTISMLITSMETSVSTSISTASDTVSGQSTDSFMSSQSTTISPTTASDQVTSTSITTTDTTTAAANISLAQSLSVWSPSPIVPTITPGPDRQLMFKCPYYTMNSWSHLNDERFDVLWQINDVDIITKTNLQLSDIEASARLKSTDWTAQGISMGFNVKCGIRFNNTNNNWNPWVMSSYEYFAGIRMWQTTRTISSGETAYFYAWLTVPLACQQGQADCKLQVSMLDFSEEITSGAPKSCDPSLIEKSKPSLCGLELDGWYRWQRLELSLPASNEATMEFKAIVGLQVSSTSATADQMWVGYTLPEITINVVNDNVTYDYWYQYGYCFSGTDPNYWTFDYKWYNHNGLGEYVLYKVEGKPIAIHTMQRRFSANHGWTEHCAVAIQAGNEILIIYGCSNPTKWKVRRYGCDPNNELLKVYSRWGGYEITLPTGTTIYIWISMNRRLNYFIVASRTDRGKTQGLCGTWNGNYADEWKGSDGQIKTSTTAFGRSWKVDPADSLFIYKTRTAILTQAVLHCTCSDSTVSGASPSVDCSWRETRPVCPRKNWDRKACSVRSKRSTDTDSDDDETEIDSVIEYEEGPEVSLDWKNGWTSDNATATCYSYFNSSGLFEACSSIPNVNVTESISLCVTDIQVSGVDENMPDSFENLVAQCEAQVRTNSSLWDNSTTTNLAELIQNSICPSQCTYNNSKNGDCVNSTCECYSGYVGGDCRINLNLPPNVVTELSDDSTCDASTTGRCTYASVFGDGFYESVNLKCLVEKAELINNELVRNGTSITTVAEFINLMEVRCPLTNDGRRRRKRSTSTSTSTNVYLVSVTNNGVNYSDPTTFVTYDASCSTCSTANNVVVCQLRSDICVIDGVCYASTSSKCSTDDSSNSKIWIIGGVISGLLLIIIVILLIKWFKPKWPINPICGSTKEATRFGEAYGPESSDSRPGSADSFTRVEV